MELNPGVMSVLECTRERWERKKVNEGSKK